MVNLDAYNTYPPISFIHSLIYDHFVLFAENANISLLPDYGSDEHREMWHMRLREVIFLYATF